MDFMKLLRSFEEFLFEAASWLLFYPLTVWRIVTRPLTTMAYSDGEQGDDTEHRYDDALSPPLLLLVTVVLMNLLVTALHVAQPLPDTTTAKAIFDSPQNAAVFRGLAFSLMPLVAAATLLRRQGQRLSRQSLRPPFYAQCYLATPCAIVLGLGEAIIHRADLPNAVGYGLMLAGAVWFLVTQTRWFAQRLGIGLGPAALTACFAVLRALGYLLLVLVPIAVV